MGVNYVHLINYMCPYGEGQISFSLNVDLEKKEKVSDFSELCDVIKTFGEEGIEASGYYVSSTDQNDHKQIIKVRCLDGLTIEPIFEEPKVKVLTRVAATTPKSVSVLNAPAVLSDTVNDKLVTLSGLAKFKEKCDGTYQEKHQLHTIMASLRQHDTNGYYDCRIFFNISLPYGVTLTSIEDIFNYYLTNNYPSFPLPATGYVKASLTGSEASYKGMVVAISFDIESMVYSIITVNINTMNPYLLDNLEVINFYDYVLSEEVQ